MVVAAIISTILGLARAPCRAAWRPPLPCLDCVLGEGSPVPAVSQLAEVRGQNSSEGGQVNLGPAVAVVVRAQPAAEND